MTTKKARFETNYDVDFSQRTPALGANPMFARRWSPRSFRKVDIPQATLETIFDAARWSPSCFNEQPWLFVTSTGAQDFPRFLDLLLPGNQGWAQHAAVLGFIFARKNFTHDGTPNAWAPFDCGAAWLALALQASALGLYAHGMAGIKREAACAALGVSARDYEAIAGFALGVIDEPAKLESEELRKMERPNTRRPLTEIWKQGSFK